jgi:hypothetical protein
MTSKIFIQSSKNPECRYEVLSFDTATQTATLMGRWGATFEITPFTKEKIEKDGYKLETVEVANA